MKQFTRSQYATIAGLAFAAAGLLATACGSDDDSPTGAETAPNNPAPGTGTAGAGTGGTTGTAPDDGTTPSTGTGGTSTPGGTNEQPPGNVPISDPENPPPGAGGTTSTEPPPPPPAAGLAPNCAAAEGPVPALTLTPVGGAFDRPLFVTQAPGDDSRLFVVEKRGTVQVLVDGQVQAQPFVDVSEHLTDNALRERGLLGLAFHPDYAQNGLFYLHFSASGTENIPLGDDVIVEFKVSTDPNVADAASLRQVLVVPSLEENHNGGMLAFGPDKMLYLGFGDGGGGGDQHGPNGNGQALDQLLGKLLRIDVNGRDTAGAYGIPEGNFAALSGVATTRPEIFAYGLRNPWRFSFDACTNDLYIGDVGQDRIEELDFLAAGSPAGTNFGWRVTEANECYNPAGGQPLANCAQDGITFPVDSYPRAMGTSVTGGYVYRGSAVPGLRGHYIYADYNSVRFFRFRIENGAAADKQEITDQLRPAGSDLGGISSFGQDHAGEVYVTAFNPQGGVYRVTAAAQ